MKSKAFSGKSTAGNSVRVGALVVLLATLAASCAPPATVASPTPTQPIPATATTIPVVDTATSVPAPTVSRATGEAILQQTLAAMPTHTPAPTPQITFPATVPDFTLKGANDVTFNLYDQLAKGPVVLQFFRMAGWSPDPQLVELHKNYQKFQDAGVEVAAVTVASVGAVSSWCQKGSIEYPMLADKDHVVADIFGVTEAAVDGRLAPAVFIIEPDKSISWYHVGATYREHASVEEILSHLP